ncbi:MAG: sugar phosphate isomerase/epimerase [Anaerohalosphaera sp.]|nr:sugar phosphate isomerase/epimerase [Anaerohalosphaera sp.]
MKIGLNFLLWTTHVTDEHFHLFEMLKQNGYDGAEIPVMSGNIDHYKILSDVIKDNGLECTCCTALPGPHADPISPDKSVRQAGLDYLKWCIDCVAALGSNILCGPTFQALGSFTGTGPTIEEKQRVLEVHQTIADYAAQSNITIATEPLNRFECFFLNTLADADQHVEDVGRDNFGILFDTFHANIEENDPVSVIQRYGRNIRHVHFSENNRGIPGTGHVDFAGTLKSLRDLGYDGWIVAEVFGRALPDLAAATCIWRDMFESPEQVCSKTYQFITNL